MFYQMRIGEKEKPLKSNYLSNGLMNLNDWFQEFFFLFLWWSKYQAKQKVIFELVYQGHLSVFKNKDVSSNEQTWYDHICLEIH
jgi:hypothetical protein